MKHFSTESLNNSSKLKGLSKLPNRIQITLEEYLYHETYLNVRLNPF